MNRNLSLTVFLVLCALYIVHDTYYYPQLPDRVASHFDTFGRPDGWSSKSSYFRHSLIAGVFAMLVFLGSYYFLRKMPDTMINLFFNLQKRNDRLTIGQRRDIISTISRFMLWPASVVLLMLIAFDHQAIRMNLGKADLLEYPLIIMACGLALTGVCCIPLYLKFRKKYPSL